MQVLLLGTSLSRKTYLMSPLRLRIHGPAIVWAFAFCSRLLLGCELEQGPVPSRVPSDADLFKATGFLLQPSSWPKLNGVMPVCVFCFLSRYPMLRLTLPACLSPSTSTSSGTYSQPTLACRTILSSGWPTQSGKCCPSSPTLPATPCRLSSSRQCMGGLWLCPSSPTL